MKTKFTQNIILLLLLNVIIKPFWIFGIDISIQNKVGAEQYGLYFSLFGFSLIFNIFSDLGITNHNNRYVAQNQNLVHLKLGEIIPVKLLLSIIYALITIVAGLIIGYSYYQIFLLSWLIFNQILISISQYLRSNIAGLQLFNINSLLSVADKAILIIICAWLLWFSPSKTFKIEWLIYAQTIAYTVGMLLSFFVVLAHTETIKLHFSLKSIFKILRESLPFASYIFLMTIYTRIDNVMIERMLPNGKMQSGIYAQAFRLLDALYMITVLFGSILLPLFAKLLKDKADITNVLQQSLTLLLVPLSALMIAVFLYSNNIIQLLYNEHVITTSNIFILLIIGFQGIAAGYIFGTLLTAAGKLKLLNIIASFAVLINVIANYIVIPKYGIIGAAFSSMATQIIVGIWQISSSLSIFKLKISKKILFKWSLFLIFLALSSILIYFFIKTWYISFVIILGIAFPIAWLFGVIEIKKLLFN